MDEDDGEPRVHECIICSQELCDDIAALTCGHVFHRSCVVKWLRTPLSRSKCPLCKANINESKGIISLYFQSRPLLRIDEEVRKNIEECGNRDELVKMNLLLKAKCDNQAELVGEQHSKINDLGETVRTLKEKIDDHADEKLTLERLLKKSDVNIERLEYELSKKISEHKETMAMLQTYKRQMDAESYRKDPSPVDEVIKSNGLKTLDRGKLAELVQTQHIAASLHKREYEKLVREKNAIAAELRVLESQKQAALHRTRSIENNSSAINRSVGNSKKRKKNRGTVHDFGFGINDKEDFTKQRNPAKINEQYVPQIRHTSRGSLKQVKHSTKSKSNWQSQHGLLGGNRKKVPRGGKAKYIVSGYDELGRMREFRKEA